MGMTYEELGIYGRLRKMDKCGPVSMFQRLLGKWHGASSAGEIAAKVLPPLPCRCFCRRLRWYPPLPPRRR